MAHIRIEKLISIAQVAGKAVLDIYNSNDELSISEKADKSPLTEADLAAHNIIAEALSTLTPDIPLLSEESKEISWEERKTWQTYWLIDPVDGTKEFINHTDEFTINIALIHEHQVVQSVVYAPALDKLYYFTKKQGAFLTNASGTHQIQATKNLPEQVRVVASRRHGDNDELKKLLTQLSNHTLLNAGSSLKICLIAEGKADLYPRFGPTSEWDTAAAQGVLEEAGGKLTNLKGRSLAYNEKQDILNPKFIAGTTELIEKLSF